MTFSCLTATLDYFYIIFDFCAKIEPIRFIFFNKQDFNNKKTCVYIDYQIYFVMIDLHSIFRIDYLCKEQTSKVNSCM